MATLKIVLRKEKKADGLYPLTIRVTKDRKSSYIYTDYRISEKDWDAKESRVKKSHPNSTRLNNLLAKKLSEASGHSIELETNHTVVTATAVKKKVKPAAGASFFAQAQLYLDQLKAAGKYNRYTPDKSRLANFQTWLKRDHAFQDITIPMLRRFKSYVVSELGSSERTAMNHLVVIRSVFSQAVEEKVVDERYYPFGKGKIAIKLPEGNKIGLNRQEIKRLEEAELTGKADHARNLWLLSFYFAGMRASDVFRLAWSDFQDFRLHYTMGKNSKGGSLKVPGKVDDILAKYEQFKENDDDLVFPELRGVDLADRFVMERTIAFKISATDKVLQKDVAPIAKITKSLTMHIARHSFGSLAGDKIPIQMLQKLYRHSDIKTTIGYQANFIHQEADDALEAVLNEKAPVSDKLKRTPKPE